ncbi:hypothetical protein AK95_13130 [Paenibacillus sp. LC231]|uniref:hypothetical protein n=1 Tax=Paenibacillus sp. LC231 TaxID=1120679 RepID=UPI0008DE6C92|nr:hypothetical protein [Paenibacillus sp. LC231]OIB04553.1 hypothetical protein AK95_13130 [Paenibacillus sp. LC231]
MLLKETLDIDKARYILVHENRFLDQGCHVKEGKMYKIERNFSNTLFHNGEAYIMDEDGKENEAVFLVCKSQLYI